LPGRVVHSICIGARGGTRAALDAKFDFFTARNGTQLLYETVATLFIFFHGAPTYAFIFYGTILSGIQLEGYDHTQSKNIGI
jgi:hypothetical protein